MSRRNRRGAFFGSASRVGVARWSQLYGAAPPDVMLTITQPVLFDIDALVHGLEIEGAGELIFDPNASRILRIDQQRPVCVMEGGHLEMVPASAAVTHEIRFINVDESLYTQGGGMNHTANPGLCVENATVKLQGATKTGWTRTTHAMLSGATTCTVADASGWRIGDEIVITPTELPSVTSHWIHFDRKTLTNVVGNVLTFTATTYPHPSNTAPSGVTIFPEVVNLTRNVIISGQDNTHRGQIMFMEDCTGSILEYFEGKYLGPRQAVSSTGQTGGGYDYVVLGRYMLHFHLMGEGSRGINVTGVSMHDGGSRGYVPHASHGMTFTDCVVWDTASEGFWWDIEPAFPNGGINETDDLVYDHCFAGRIKGIGSVGGETGFMLAMGTNMTVRNSCVAAIDGNNDAPGYHWPDSGNGDPHNIWTFHDNDAHNSSTGDGIFVWQNDGNHHEIDRFRGWNNGKAGIYHGAYVNQYHYTDCEVWGNGRPVPSTQFLGDFHLLAMSGENFPGDPRGVQILGGHIPLVIFAEHNVVGPRRPVFRNVTIGAVKIVEDTHQSPSNVDFIDCGIDHTNITIPTGGIDASGNPNGMHLNSVIRVQLGASAWRITTTDTANKIVTPIATFYP